MRMKEVRDSRGARYKLMAFESPAIIVRVLMEEEMRWCSYTECVKRERESGWSCVEQ